MNDQEIIALYWAKEERAISATAEKYGSYCHAIAYNILYDRFDAEECVNDTYLGAWNSIPPQRPNRLAAFLGKITRNLALNRYKRTMPQSAAEDKLKLLCPNWKTASPTLKALSRLRKKRCWCP